jgi:hypothetical protein
VSKHELNHLIENLRCELDVDYDLDVNNGEVSDGFKIVNEAINSYFDNIGWSLLKAEWDVLSADEKRAFVMAVYKAL